MNGQIFKTLFEVLSTFGSINQTKNGNGFYITNPTNVDMSALESAVSEIDGWICTHRKLEDCRSYTDDNGAVKMEKPQVWVGVAKNKVTGVDNFLDRASKMF